MPPSQADPQLINSFVAVLFVALIAATLLVMGGFSLLEWAANRFGWFADHAQQARRPSRRRLRHLNMQVAVPQPRTQGDDLGLVCETPVRQGVAHVSASEVTPLPTTSPAEWLELLNNRPDTVPHLVIVGGSGTGKTTLATALLAARPGQTLIITPKPDDDWGGLPAITIDDDGSFTTAADTFSRLLAEVRRRLVATKRRQEPGPWLTVVLDDYPALRAACPDADPAFLLVAQLGRSLRVRLVVLSYSGLVKELGLEGRGESRNHFVWVRLDRQRRATLEWDEQTLTLDTSEVLRLAQTRIPAHRWWSPTTLSPNGTTTPIERREANIRTATTTTTTEPVGARLVAASPVVVVETVPREGVALSEQVSILLAAVRMREGGANVNRTEICRQVFDGQSGGAAFRKVKAVLDAAGL